MFASMIVCLAQRQARNGRRACVTKKRRERSKLLFAF